MSSVEEIPPVASPDSKDDDMTYVDASESELVDDEMKSLRFGRSLMIEEALTPLVQRKTLNRDIVRLSEIEKVLKPQLAKCVVFRIILVLGFASPFMFCWKMHITLRCTT
jgi:hypothetical protein